MSSSSAFSIARIDRIDPGPDEPIEYLTDVEGNINYVRNWLRFSKLLCEKSSSSSSSSLAGDAPSPSRKRQRPESDFELEFTSDKGYFVFGGDSVDKGPGDIQWTRALISLKKRYPSRVFLILGNRDINKLRFATEVAAGVAGEDVRVAWDPKHTKYRDWLAHHNHPSWPSGSVEDRVHVCKWMLECTMGSATTFELRKQELAYLNDLDMPDHVSDQDVLASYLDCVDRFKDDREAYMLAYLKYGQLALRAGSALIVHGAVNDWNCGVLPCGAGAAASLDDWVAALNDFAQRQVRAFVDDGVAPLALMDYGVGVSPTVVYTTYLDNGNGKFPGPKTVDFLRASGVDTVLVGHAPHGDSPLVMRDQRLTVVTADTSYSDVSAADNRGVAVSHLTFDGSLVKVVGVLKDGSQHTFDIDVKQAPPASGVYFIGQQQPDASWIKTYCPTRRQFLKVRGEGYRLTYDWIDE